MAGFIKETEVKILEEDYRVDDLLDFGDEVERLDERVRRLQYSSLIGYVGRFGSGKSTAIYQLQKKYGAETTARWFEFDAWKYPERKDLWEGFVLDIADQLGHRKRTEKKLDGTSTTSKTIGAVAQIAEGLKILPGASIVADKLSQLFGGQPIERVYEMQELLVKMFSTLKETSIFIVVEDLDRSGDAGRYFLETLRQFVKNNLPEKRIVVIVPIGSTAYENDEFRDSYRKALDYVLFFQPQLVAYTQFIKRVFDEDAFPKDVQVDENPNHRVASAWKQHLATWFTIAVQQKLTIREIKAVIREANLIHIDLSEKDYDSDPRMVLAFTLLNHTFMEGGTRWINMTHPPNQIDESNPIQHLIALVAHNESEQEYKSNAWVPMRTLWHVGKGRGVPFYDNGNRRLDGNGHYAISDFYLYPFGYRAPRK